VEECGQLKDLVEELESACLSLKHYLFLSLFYLLMFPSPCITSDNHCCFENLFKRVCTQVNPFQTYWIKLKIWFSCLHFGTFLRCMQDFNCWQKVGNLNMANLKLKELRRPNTGEKSVIEKFRKLIS
jgi:hypothetical protein